MMNDNIYKGVSFKDAQEISESLKVGKSVSTTTTRGPTKKAE